MILRRKVFFFIGLAAGVILLAGAVIYAVFTTKGSNFISRPLFSKYIEAESTSVKETTGSFFETLVYHDLEFRNLKWLPRENSLQIQRLEIAVSSLSLEGLSIRIHNGKLKFSGSDAVLFYGDFQNGILDITVYSNGINIREVLDSFFGAAVLKKISGVFGDADVNIKGSLFQPEIDGSFNVEKLTRNSFSMSNCNGEVNLQFKDIKDDFKLNGQILLKSGVISGPKTAVINLKESKIMFEDNPKRPMLDLKGLAIVEKVKINISVKGDFDHPQLNLTSEPFMGQDRLLVMLATNKAWQSIETAVNKQELSADIAKDFLDYFIFSGSGKKIAEKYGIRDISVKYNGTTAGVGAVKDITDKTAISYSVEQPRQKKEDTTASHKIGGKYKITENVLIGAEKELKQKNKTEPEQDKQSGNDRVILEFKKDF